jgi:hypothetical protein
MFFVNNPNLMGRPRIPIPENHVDVSRCCAACVAWDHHCRNAVAHQALGQDPGWRPDPAGLKVLPRATQI